MSSQYLNQSVQNQNINIKVHDAVIDGELSVVENSSFSGKLTVGGYVQSGSLLLNGIHKSVPNVAHNYIWCGRTIYY